MSEYQRKTFVTTVVGVGREDYSQNVEYSVESEIRSWQQEYRHWEEFSLAAGATVTREIDIQERTVVIPYDFFLSVPANILIHLRLEFLAADGVTWSPIQEKSGYQNVTIKYSRGFPLFDKYRIIVTNYGEIDVTASFSAHGTVTDEDIYYGEIVA